MKDLPIRNIFLPAALVGTSLFSALAFTLPVFLSKSDYATSDASRPNFKGFHKEVVLTYVGTAIVVSASAGLGAAELLRRRTEKRSKTPDFKSALAEFVDHHAQSALSDSDAQFAELLGHLPVDSPQSDFGLSEPLVEAPSPSQPLGSLPSPSSSAAPADRVIIFPGQYQRCRIQTADLHHRQYAIEFNGQFYTLLSSGRTKEQALAAVEQLAREQQEAIITQMNQGYAVWVMAPNSKQVGVA